MEVGDKEQRHNILSYSFSPNKTSEVRHRVCTGKMQIAEIMGTEPLHIFWLFDYAITIALVSLLAKCLRFKTGCQKNIILNRGTKDSANVMPVRISHSGRIIIAFRQWFQRSDIIPFPHLEKYFAVFIIITFWTWLIHRLDKYTQLNFPYLVFACLHQSILTILPFQYASI